VTRDPSPETRLGLLATGDARARVVVGLGNAERAYARTRHNLGALAVARAVARLGLKPAPGQIPVPAARAAFVLPTGFMNESGPPVRRAVERWRPAAHGLLVVHDDMDLPLGTVWEKEGGGHGGHNGLRDVVATLGTGAFKRLRLGIGRPPGRLDPVDYVLSPFRPGERDAVELMLEEACEAILRFAEARD
jgi:peptidyl-tRNA hydrolase, PTH1 family